MLIEHLIDLHPTDALTIDLTISDLDGFYKAARGKFDSDEVFAHRARQRVVSLQGGDADSLVLWKKLCAESRRYFQAVYDRLGITLRTGIAGESLVQRRARAGTVARGHAEQGPERRVESDGAICVFPPGFANKEGKPVPIIIRKQRRRVRLRDDRSRGHQYRLQKLGATRVIYVVGAPSVAAPRRWSTTAELAGWLAPPARAEHVAFGSVLGEDKKMFKSRTGESSS
jgi:arginyl-tRNA synthetase